MKTAKTIGILIAIVAILAFASPQYAAYQMKSAIDDNNPEALSEYIDFPSVRESFKAQLNIHLTKKIAEDKDSEDQDPFKALGQTLALAMSDKVVDMYVTPAGISEMMAGKAFRGAAGPAPAASASSEPSLDKKAFENVTTSFDSLSKYSIEVPNESGDVAKFILRRNGFEWRLSEIIVPMK